MGLFSNIRSFFAGAKDWDEGLNITRSEAVAMARHSSENAEAYGYLLDAMDVANGVFPTTQAEADKMHDLLEMADAAATNPSEHDYSTLSSELHSIVDWSLKRHLTVSWLCLLGVVLTLWFVSWRHEDTATDLAHIEAIYDGIDEWEEQEVPAISYDQALSLKNASDRYIDSIRFGSATTYKKIMLIQAASSHKTYTDWAAENKMRRDTATTDERKESYAKQYEEYTEQAEEVMKRFNTISKMDFDDIQDAAKEDCETWVAHQKRDANSMLKWYIFFCLLIPLYFVASLPHGYTITRTREEAASLKGIQKIGLWISGGLLGMGALLQFGEIVRHWSNGSTTREDDGFGPVILVLKILFVVAAVAVFCILSTLIITYCTVVGLIRNYNWKDIFHKTKKIATDTAAKAKEMQKK